MHLSHVCPLSALQRLPTLLEHWTYPYIEFTHTNKKKTIFCWAKRVHIFLLLIFILIMYDSGTKLSILMQKSFSMIVSEENFSFLKLCQVYWRNKNVVLLLQSGNEIKYHIIFFSTYSSSTHRYVVLYYICYVCMLLFFFLLSSSFYSMNVIVYCTYRVYVVWCVLYISLFAYARIQ